MSTTPSLSGFIIVGIIAAGVATSFLDSRYVFVHAEDTARSSIGLTPDVNRARKSDRLSDLSGTDATVRPSTDNTTVVKKNAAAPELAKGAKGRPTQQKAFEFNGATPASKRAPASLVGCEPVASPIVDLALSQIIGRCIV
jgi:hypothetical protein